MTKGSNLKIVAFLLDDIIKLIYNSRQERIDTMKKVKTSMNLAPAVFKMFKEQAKAKGLDNGSYLTYLVHEKSNKKDFQKKLEGIFLDALQKGVKKDEEI